MNEESKVPEGAKLAQNHISEEGARQGTHLVWLMLSLSLFHCPRLHWGVA
jgi:hypothetical protein